MKINKSRWVIVLAVLLWLIAGPVAADTGGMALVGQSVVIERGQTVNGDVALLAGSIEIAADAVVRGDLAVIGGSARVDGIIEGDAAILGGNMVLGPTAWIKGDVVALGSLTRDPAARIDGNVVAGAERSAQLREVRQSLQEQMNVPDVAVPRTPVSDAATARMWNQLRWVAGVLGMILLAAIVVAVLPEAISRVSTVMGRTVLLSTAVGLLTLIAVGVLIPLLTIIIIGIPVVLVLGIGLLLAGLCGWVAASLLVGRKLLGLANISSSSTVLDVAAGIVALALVGRVPCLGALFTFAVVCWGLGAIVLTRFGTSPSLIWAPFEPMASRAMGNPADTDPSPDSGQEPSHETPQPPLDSSTRREDDAGTRRL
jgi:cytoskeletal protein CcmA (bactofilin family)